MFKNITKDTFKDTLKMAWPSVVEFFFAALATIIDSLMVSGLGKEAVAAVGLTSQPILLRLSFFTAINIALSALIARRKGEKQPKTANRILITALLMTVILAIVISGVFIGIADPLIRFIGSNKDTHDMAVTYFRILCAGTIFTVLQNCINAAQRGAGNTKIAMRTHLVSSAVNIVLNFLLIEGRFGFPRLEITGAAIATVAGMFVASVLSILSLLKKDSFLSFVFIMKEKLRPAKKAFFSIIKLGYSVFIEQILLRIGFMATSMMVARQGTDSMAAHQVGMNLLSLSFAFGDGLQASAVALVGRSIGENRLDKAKAYTNVSRIFGLIAALTLSMIYLFFSKFLYGLFFPGEDAVIAIGVNISKICAVVIIFQILQVINTGCLHGAGDTLFTAIMGVTCVTVIRTVVSYVFGIYIDWALTGILGIWLGIFADQFSRFVMTTIRMSSGKWLQIKI